MSMAADPRLEDPRNAAVIGTRSAKAKVEENPQGKTIADEKIIERW
ncbi:MAG: hypothetical protein AAF557_16940 [Pseudomonadota bacterium]